MSLRVRRFRQRRSTALLFAGALALMGDYCPQAMGPVVGIVSPGDGAALTRAPLQIELKVLVHADPQSLVVRLNGTDISDRFVVDPPQGSHRVGWAEDVWGDALVLDGANTLEAEVSLHGIVHTDQVQFDAEGDAYADAVDSYAIGTGGGFNLAFLPDVVLGPPTGSGLYGGTLGVFSLGLLGEIVLEFTDNVIVDGPGVDFTVFENPFFETALFEVIDDLFSEPGTVSVSQDGSTWYAFACDDTVAEHPYYPGCAGVYPVLANGETDALHPSMPTLAPAIESFIGQQKPNVPVPDGSGGDSYDLAAVGLGWARYVKIEAADHVVGPVGPDNAGFDLDAAAAVNSAPATDANMNGIPDAVE